MTIMEQLEPTLEQRENAAELWNNPDVVTISFRRHGQYGNDPSPEKLKTFGTLIGRDATREAAKEWHKKVPDGADISIYESPSFFQENPSSSSSRNKAMRATQSASIYEKETFGDLAPSIDSDSGPIPKMSSRRKRTPILGDFMINATNPKLIPLFMAEVSEIYGKDKEYEFWRDLAQGNLKPEIKKALADCGGLDNLDMAGNLLTFLREESENLKNRKNEDSKKEAAIALTHSETIGSFAGLLDRYLESKGEKPAQALYKEIKRGYNEGFDTHIKGDKLIVEREGALLAKIDLDEVESFLDKLGAEDKKGKNTKQ